MKVTAIEAGRADKELARHYPEAGRRQLAELFDEGCVRVNGKRAKKGDRVEVGDLMELTRAPVTGEAFRPVPDAEAAERLVVLLERPELIVVAKPAGMPTQPLKAGELGTVASGIAHRWPECAAIGDDPRDGGLVHRLDIGTSGALIAARSLDAYRELREAFGTGRVDKVYLAIVDGRPVARECDAPLVQRGKKVAVDHTDGLAAHTAFSVDRASASHALVHCHARTGRMHQVRAHLAYVGAPISGDTLYGGTTVSGTEGFFLHAAIVTFPLGTQQIKVEAPLPERFTQALAACGL
ncbi:MAG: RluA family pseudouridine synthase [Deltaproteobacteria bacterium]|nr:RluA family pseudouridine synthase [Deltaproteobacteria bacterium]